MSSTANWTVTGVTNLTEDTYIATKRLKTIATSGDYNDLANKLPITSNVTSTSFPNNLTVTNPDDANSSAIFTLAKYAGHYITGSAISDLCIRNRVGRIMLGVNAGALSAITVNADNSVTQRNTTFTLGMTSTTGSFTSLTVNGNNVAPQVNSDWTATTGVAQVLNKPILGAAAISNSYPDLINRPALGSAATSNNLLDLNNARITNTGNTIVYVNNTNGVLPTLPNSGGYMLWNLNSGSGTHTFLCNSPSGVTGGWDWQQYTASVKALTCMSLSSSGNLGVPGTISAAGQQILPQVSADWNATSGVAQILNKPNLTSGGSTPYFIAVSSNTAGNTAPPTVPANGQYTLPLNQFVAGKNMTASALTTNGVTIPVTGVWDVNGTVQASSTTQGFFVIRAVTADNSYASFTTLPGVLPGCSFGTSMILANQYNYPSFSSPVYLTAGQKVFLNGGNGTTAVANVANIYLTLALISAG